MTLTYPNHTPSFTPQNAMGEARLDIHKPYKSKKCTFWRFRDSTPAKCFFCKADTFYILVYRDGSEDFACKSCLWTRGKIKRFCSSHIKPLVDTKQTKLSEVSCVEMEKQGVLF